MFNSHSSHRSILACSLLTAFCGATLPAAQQDVDWLGGAGAWTDATHWNKGVVPNNTGTDTFHAFIDHGLATASEVSLDAGVTIDALSISAGDSLNIHSGDGVSFDATAGSASLENSGLISLDAGGISVLQGDLSLTGGGGLSLSDSANNFLTGTGAAARLINEDNVISGAGQIGQDSLAIVNRGKIRATMATALVIDPNASGAVNSGVLEARDGGWLALTGGNFVNSENGQDGTILANGSRVDITSTTYGGASVAGGLIRVDGAGELRLANASIVGSSVQNSSTGVIRVATMTGSTIDGSLNNPLGGQVIIEDRSTLRLTATGTYHNDGEIWVNGVTSTLTLLQVENATVEGSGRIKLGPNPGTLIFGKLTNNGNSIEGVGGIDSSGFTNRGTVSANLFSSTLDLYQYLWTNAGIFEAVNGGILNIYTHSPSLNSEGGIDGMIRAANGSQVIVGSVTGGNLDVQSGGIMNMGGTLSGVDLHVASGGTIDSGSWWTTTGNSTVTIDAGSQVNVKNTYAWTLVGPGTFVNNGVIRLGDAGGAGSLHNSGDDVTIAGTGEIDMTGNSANWIHPWFPPPPTSLTIGAGQTIHGTGHIGSYSEHCAILNYGTIIADQVSPLELIANTGSPPFTYFDHYGELIASGPGGFIISGAVFRSWGEILVLPGSRLMVGYWMSMNGGSTIVEGTMSVPSTAPDFFHFRMEGGVLGGNGVIDVNVSNGGVVAPGSSTGVLTILRKYKQTHSGELLAEIGGVTVGTQYDRLVVGGVATLDGTLRVEFVNGFVPDVGNHFTIMTYPSKVGNFSNMILPRLHGKIVEVAVGDTQVVVSIASKAQLIQPFNLVEAFIDTFIP